MKDKLQANLWKLYLIKALRWFMLVMPIIVLFFQDNGLSLTQILLLQSIFSLAIIIFEIPSGYFSDVFGRKLTIVFACIVSFLGLSIYTFAYDFFTILIAEILLGIGSSFLSGTDSAMMYDSLVELKQVDKYQKTEGRMTSIGNFSEGLASILGGFLAVISLRTPFVVEAAISFFTIPIALSLFEPPRHKLKAKQNAIKNIMKIVKYSLHDHKEIKWLILYTGFVGASTLTMVWFIQPYFNLVGLPLSFFGITWAALQFSVGIFSLYAYKYELILGRKKSLLSLIFIIFTAYLLTALTKSLWSILFIFLFYFVRGISSVVLKDYVNKLISSDIRATVLSVKALVGRLIFVVVGPFIGYLADVYTLQIAFMYAACIFVLAGITSLIFLHKHKAL